jgi:energy-coupling factor transporter ATP-binding protein EcfA2
MIKVKEALQEATKKISESFISQTPLLDASLLLMQVTNLKRHQLYSASEQKLREDQYKIFTSLVEKRLDGEPIAYLIGFKEFYGHTFKVNNSVLIPRSDSEVVVEKALELVKRWERPKVLDLCTGSGCLGISVAAADKRVEMTLSDISFDALVGPNGSGKSTLSRSLCGLDSLVAGSISVNGVEFTQKQLQTNVGYLFQNPDYGIFLPTVGSEIGWSLRNNKEMSKKEKEQLVLECANLFNLNVDDNPTMMSYGSRKRVQAAVAYMLNRPFLIIDELDSALTYADSYKIVELLRSNGSAIVIISHDYNFANILAKRIYTIVDGNVVEKEGLL